MIIILSLTGKQKSIATVNPDLDEVFRDIQGALSPEMVANVNTVFEFDFQDGVVLFVDVKHGSGDVGVGKPKGDADVVFTVKADDFVKLARGHLSPTAAVMQGKLRFDGSLTNASKLETVLKRVRSKL